jgi:hypothetical protein
MLLLGGAINWLWPVRLDATPPSPALFADFGLIAAYSAFLIGTALVPARKRFGERALGVAIVAATTVGAIADVIENAYGLQTPSGFSLPPALAATAFKWGYFFAAIIFAGALMVLRESPARRIGGLLLLLAGIFGFSGLFGGAEALRTTGVAIATVGALVAALLPVVFTALGDRMAPTAASAVDWNIQLHDENTAIDRARERSRRGRGPRASADRFGLALSGGGIRSATFNLGLLQALHSLGILEIFDYLATVSGGGYIGAFWTAWRSRQPRHRDHADGHTAPTFPEPAFASLDVEAEEIRHLREFSNFLSPRLGVLSFDTGRMVVAAFSAMVPAISAALALIVLGIEVWLVLAWSILGPIDHHGVPRGFSAIIVALVAGSVLIVAEAMWVKRGERGTSAYGAATLLGTTLSAIAWWLFMPEPNLYHIASPVLPVISDAQPVTDWLTLYAPAGAWVAAALVIVVGRWIRSSATRDPAARAVRTSFDRVTSRLLFTSMAWIVISTIWIVGAALWHWLFGETGTGVKGVAGLAGTATALGMAFRTVQRVFSRQPNKPSGGRMAAMLRPKLPQLIAYSMIALMTASAAACIISLGYVESGVESDRWAASVASLAWVVVAPVIITVATVLFFEPNEVGLHSFYRARLARAFLGASNLAAGRRTEEDSKDDVRMSELAEGLPLHLVCCAANDLDSIDHIANLHRGAVSSSLSRLGFSVGESFRPWNPKTYIPTLGSAITASGAAFNSHMGSKSMELGAGVTFLMTAFNLRLGMWLPHPRSYEHRAQRWLPGLPFYGEMFGRSRARGPSVLLSDGGHFENMALYELIRRRCRFILAADCGADPDVGFDDLGNFVRRVREDFGVEIDIDTTPLRPDQDGFAHQPMVAGDIHYDDGTSGVLLLIKPTIVGNEPIDILQYKRRNESFPHESTGDQFYDEAQWESYRRLGEHAGLAAMQRAKDALSDELPVSEMGSLRWGARLFARARMFWQPVPSGVRERLPKIVNRIAELDTMLHRESCTRILPQVYREVDELDREVRRRGGDGVATSSSPTAAPALSALPQTVSRPVTAQSAAAQTAYTPVSDAASTEPIILPAVKDLAPSLHVMRSAVLFMEEMFISENLERYYNHPVYLGLMNYFARWAYAPVFRMWWPLLRSLYTRRFTSFMERMYDLESVTRVGTRNECVTISVDSSPEGFASHCWSFDQRRHRPPRPGELMLGFNIEMHYQNPYPPVLVEPYKVQAALARIRLLEIQNRTTAMWTADDFYVPPGLWGMGVGERFLDVLVRQQHNEFGNRNVATLLVAIPLPPQSRGAVRKEGADLTAMYRAAGFWEWQDADPSGRLSGEFTMLATGEMAGVPRPGLPADSRVKTFRWMRLDREHREA